jgi:hypothetical protein
MCSGARRCTALLLRITRTTRKQSVRVPQRGFHAPLGRSLSLIVLLQPPHRHAAPICALRRGVARPWRQRTRCRYNERTEQRRSGAIAHAHFEPRYSTKQKTKMTCGSGGGGSGGSGGSSARGGGGRALLVAELWAANKCVCCRRPCLVAELWAANKCVCCRRRFRLASSGKMMKFSGRELLAQSPQQRANTLLLQGRDGRKGLVRGQRHASAMAGTRASSIIEPAPGRRTQSHLAAPVRSSSWCTRRGWVSRRGALRHGVPGRARGRAVQLPAGAGYRHSATPFHTFPHIDSPQQPCARLGMRSSK